MTERAADTPIPPALTPEQWAEWIAGRGTEVGQYADRNYVFRIPTGICTGADHDHNAEITSGRHGFAALCLHEQSFGFTQEDIEALNGCLSKDPAVEDYERAHLAIAKIAALLPPKEADPPV